MVRNEAFRRVELVARKAWLALAEDGDWDADRWRDAMAPYWERHAEVGTGPSACGPELFQVDERPGRWEVRQVLDDPAGDHDWALRLAVDLAASDEAGRPVVEVTALSDAPDG